MAQDKATITCFKSGDTEDSVWSGSSFCTHNRLQVMVEPSTANNALHLPVAQNAVSPIQSVVPLVGRNVRQSFVSPRYSSTGLSYHRLCSDPHTVSETQMTIALPSYYMMLLQHKTADISYLIKNRSMPRDRHQIMPQQSLLCVCERLVGPDRSGSFL